MGKECSQFSLLIQHDGLRAGNLDMSNQQHDRPAANAKPPKGPFAAARGTLRFCSTYACMLPVLWQYSQIS